MSNSLCPQLHLLAELFSGFSVAGEHLIEIGFDWWKPDILLSRVALCGPVVPVGHDNLNLGRVGFRFCIEVSPQP